jgi:hypothetical protein
VVRAVAPRCEGVNFWISDSTAAGRGDSASHFDTRITSPAIGTSSSSAAISLGCSARSQIQTANSTDP